MIPCACKIHKRYPFNLTIQSHTQKSMNMDDHGNSHKSPYAESQQSKQGSMLAQYANYPWVPPQWIQHLNSIEFQNARNATEGLQTPQQLPQSPISTSFPSTEPQPHFPHFSALTSEELHTPAASPSWPDHPFFPRHRIPRRVSPKIDWLEYVNTLPWLPNSEFPKGDRTCPFCWGDFGMAIVHEESTEDAKNNSIDSSSSLLEDDKAGTEDAVAEYCEQTLAPTLNGNLIGGMQAMKGLHVANPDPLPAVCETEKEDEDEEMEDVKVTELTEGQSSMMRQPRRKMGIEEEKEKFGEKHYAVKLPCGHLYGHMCLVTMLDSGEMACPKCRKGIVGSEARKRRNAFSMIDT
jgi:hypothetical protein